MSEWLAYSSDEEWTVMTDGLGGVFAAGGEMKATYVETVETAQIRVVFRFAWRSPMEQLLEQWQHRRWLGYWWSSTPGGEGGYGRDILYSQVDVHRNAYDAIWDFLFVAFWMPVRVILRTQP